TRPGFEPTGMSVGFLVLVFTSIVDTVSLGLLATQAVLRHRRRAVTDDATPGATPTRSSANPDAETARTERHRRSSAHRVAVLMGSRWRSPSSATRRARDP